MPAGDQAPNLAWIANYIWGIADDVLRDLYVRGKYRDKILPITVLRRLDAVLEATKDRPLTHGLPCHQKIPKKAHILPRG